MCSGKKNSVRYSQGDALYTFDTNNGVVLETTYDGEHTGTYKIS